MVAPCLDHSADFVMFFLCDRAPRVGRKWSFQDIYFIFVRELLELFRIQSEIRDHVIAYEPGKSAIAAL